MDEQAFKTEDDGSTPTNVPNGAAMEVVYDGPRTVPIDYPQMVLLTMERNYQQNRSNYLEVVVRSRRPIVPAQAVAVPGEEANAAPSADRLVEEVQGLREEVAEVKGLLEQAQHFFAPQRAVNQNQDDQIRTEQGCSLHPFSGVMREPGNDGQSRAVSSADEAVDEDSIVTPAAPSRVPSAEEGSLVENRMNLYENSDHEEAALNDAQAEILEMGGSGREADDSNEADEEEMQVADNSQTANTTPKIYECNLCNVVLGSNKNLLRHYESKKHITAVSNKAGVQVPRSKYYCDICKVGLSRASSLIFHNASNVHLKKVAESLNDPERLGEADGSVDEMGQTGVVAAPNAVDDNLPGPSTTRNLGTDVADKGTPKRRRPVKFYMETQSDDEKDVNYVPEDDKEDSEEFSE